MFFGPEFFLVESNSQGILNCHCWEMSSVLCKLEQSYDNAVLVWSITVGKVYFCRVCTAGSQFFKNEFRPMT